MVDGQPELPKLRPHERGRVVDVSHRLGTPNLAPPEWLLPTPLDKIPKPEREAFPVPPRIHVGSLNLPKTILEVEETSARLASASVISPAPSLLRKRGYDQQNGMEAVIPLKRRAFSGGVIKSSGEPYNVSSLARSSVVNTLNGRAKMATITRVGGRKQMISWVDAPDDVYFVATDSTKKLRKQITIPEMRRAARKPCRKLNLKIPFYYETAPDPPATPAAPSGVTTMPVPLPVPIPPSEPMPILD